jgi:hypothetical protein
VVVIFHDTGDGGGCAANQRTRGGGARCSPETEVRAVLTIDGDNAARRSIAGEDEEANLGFLVGVGCGGSPAAALRVSIRTGKVHWS